jgi:hypothetical protein
MSDAATPDPRAKTKQWRNVMCPETEPDAEIRAVNAFEDQMDDVPDSAVHIRALISRIDPLSHYKAFENLDFILSAIGELDYPGSPAVDVLWRHGDIDDNRRAEAKCYITALNTWLEGVELDAAKDATPDCAAVIETAYAVLGEANDEKRWLAMSLRKTLKERAYTPWDTIEEYDDASFIRAVYQSILGRPPSPDDLQFRIEELENGKTREAFFEEILEAPEHKWGHLACIAGQLKHTGT